MNNNLLIKYFKGNTTIDEERQLLDWVDESPENKAIFQKERLFFDIAIFSEFDEKKKNQKSYTRLFLKWSVSIAASVIVLLSCGVLLKEFTTIYNLNLQTVSVPVGQRAQIVLADGTTVWLNSQSTLTYSPAFGRKNRDVILDGEAFFDVAHNKEIPFNVKTQFNRIQVVGTKFNVCAYNGTESFETSLIEGIVDVYNITDSEKPLARLNKNEKLIGTNGDYIKQEIVSHDFLRWKEGIYCFDDIPIKEVFNRLENYFNVTIVVENQGILDYRCTGKFKERDGIEHILRVIQKDLEFKFKNDTEKNTIIIK